MISEPVEVLEANDQHIRFNRYGGRVPEQYFLKRMGQKRWLLRNITPTRETKKWQHLVSEDRPGMKEIPLSKLDLTRPDQILQPKIDGAHVQVVLEANKPPRVFSYRRAKNETGFIEHTHKMPFFGTLRTPEELDGTVLRAEVFGRGEHGAIPPQDTGGLLNASVWKSREMQDRRGPLDLRTFSVDRFKGKNVASAPYSEQLSMLREVSEAMKPLKPMPTATTLAEKRKMLERIVQGKDPLTSEGVVVRDLRTGKIIKAKQRTDYDVYVREITKGRKRGEAGAFRYSLTPTGPIIGNVGTGFSRQLRKSMWKHPEEYIGRVAKVLAQQQFPSGALRAPVFTGEWHLDKGRQPFVESTPRRS